MARLSPSTYDAVREGTIKSACTVLPMLAETLGQPTGLLDVGCGEGHWLDAAEALWGPLDCMGLDVDAGRTPDGLVIERWDAEAGQPIPHSSTRRWPLALCLEMAEHVRPEAGEHLVGELCRVAERVVFSAAIPGQGGDGHVNEQPPAYWWGAFAAHGWRLSDPYRGHLWSVPCVEPWYAQNLLLAQPVGHGGGIGKSPLHLVHPAVFQAKLDSAAYWREQYLACDRQLGACLEADSGNDGRIQRAPR